MTQENGHPRAEFDQVTRDDLRLLRSALRGPTERERDVLNKLTQSRLADVQFSTDARGQLHYRIQWTEHGELRSHESTAACAAAGEATSIRHELVLDKFPATIEPLALLDGNFDCEFFGKFTDCIELPATQPKVHRSPAYDFDLEPEAFSLGASTDEYVDDVFGLGASTEEDSWLWAVTWMPGEELSIEYFADDPSNLAELPAVVSINYLDDDGNSHHHSAHVCLEKTQIADKTSWRGTIDNQKLAYPGNGILVNFEIRPLGLNDIVVEAVDAMAPSHRIASANYLASCEFEAFIGRLENTSTQVRFSPLPGESPHSAKSYALKYVPKTSEASDVDAAPFENVMAIIHETSDELFRRAARATDDVNIAEDLVQEAILPVLRDPAKYVQILINPAVDGNGALGGKEGIRRKLFSNLEGKIRDSQRSSAKRVERTATDLLPDDYGIESLAAPLQSSDYSTELQSAEYEIEQTHLAKYLSERENMVYAEAGHTVAAIVKRVSEKHDVLITPNNVRTDCKNILRKQAVLRALHRLVQPPIGDTTLFSEQEYQFVIRVKLMGEELKVTLDELGIDEASQPAFENKIEEALAVACASIALLERETGRAKQTNSVGRSNGLAHSPKNPINVRQFWMLLHWLVGLASVEELSSTFKMDVGDVQSELATLGRRIHAQVLIDQGLLSKRARNLLELWILEGNELDEAIVELKTSINKNKSIQARRRSIDSQKWKPGMKELKRHTPELDLDHVLTEVHSAWQNDTPVPSGFRQLPVLES